MRASQTVLPFKLTASDESLTAHAGLVLFDEYLGAMGIAGLINHELPGAGSAVGYDPSAHVAPLVLMLAGGGRTLEDLRVLRRDDGLRCVVGLDEMPSSDASGDWMRRMGANESGGLAGLQRVTVACSAVCCAPTSARTSRSTSMRRRSWRKSVRLVTAIRARRVTCRWWGISRKTVWPSTMNSEKAMRLRACGGRKERPPDHTIAVAFEAGHDGFWLARWLAAQGIESHVIHASSVAEGQHQAARVGRRHALETPN